MMGSADCVVRESMCVSTSCTSNRTRLRGVERSKGVSEGLLVERMRVLV